MVELIGGILVDGTLRRDVVLCELSGSAELVLAELAGSHASMPEKVTRFLTETITSIGGAPVGPDEAAALSVGDRQHLVRRIGVQLGRDLLWLGQTCKACGEDFEIPVRQSQLPVKPAGQGFPATQVDVEGQDIQIRAPNGADQAAIAGMSESTASKILLERLTSRPITFDADTARKIEAAIEDLSPEVALQASAACPECGAEALVDVDPYLTLANAGREILDDIHVLASRYHWSEAEILALPRARRKTYLSLIDQDRGVVSRDTPGGLQ